MTPSQHEVTALLVAWSDGDETALEKLAPLVYGELRQLARRHMASVADTRCKPRRSSTKPTFDL